MLRLWFPTCGWSINYPIQTAVFFHHHYKYHCGYPHLIFTSSDKQRSLHTWTFELFLLTIDIPPFDYLRPWSQIMYISLPCCKLALLQQKNQSQPPSKFLRDSCDGLLSFFQNGHWFDLYKFLLANIYAYSPMFYNIIISYT